MDSTKNTTCLLLLDLPPAAFCGIDLLSFTTSPRFRGIKVLPVGWHFVFAGITSSFSIRQGAWLYVKDSHDVSPQLFVQKWDAGAEELIEETDEQAMLTWRANLGSIWREGLTPYRQSAAAATRIENEVILEKPDWPRMTDCITDTLLSRIIGAPPTQNHWTLTSASSAPEDSDVIPGLSREESTAPSEEELSFSPVDLKQTWRQGAIGPERTEAARDRSWALSQLIENHCRSPLEIIGELQFTFLMVLLLNNNSCLLQWRRLISLLLTCKSAVVEQSEFFVRVLTALKLQLEHCQDAEGGLFDFSDEGGTMLKNLLKKFRQGLEQHAEKAPLDVMDELDELEKYLKSEYRWLMNGPHVQRGLLELEDGEQVDMDMEGADEEEETGDYAPTFVDLTPEQARQLTQEKIVNPPLTLNQKITTRSESPFAGNNEWDDDRDHGNMDARFKEPRMSADKFSCELTQRSWKCSKVTAEEQQGVTTN